MIGENGITPGEPAAEEKHNKIATIPELLDLIDIKGDKDLEKMGKHPKSVSAEEGFVKRRSGL